MRHTGIKECVNHVPLLSVLMPTYNQVGGVQRSFVGLSSLCGNEDVEFIVSDDSTDDVSAERIALLCFNFGGVRYQRNQPPRGAVQNWNWLLDQARGRYVLLLHHDEEIASTTDLPLLLQALRASDATEAVLLSCYVIHQHGKPGRLHFPTSWAAAISRRYSGYLLRRNLFGPPSSLIVRSDRCCRFDERLRWRVDTDFYYRTFSSLKLIDVWPLGGVISHRDAINSITAKLATQLEQIDSFELRLLAQSYASAPEMRWQFDGSFVSTMKRVFESVFWFGFRALFRFTQITASRTKKF